MKTIDYNLFRDEFETVHILLFFFLIKYSQKSHKRTPTMYNNFRSQNFSWVSEGYFV